MGAKTLSIQVPQISVNLQSRLSDMTKYFNGLITSIGERIKLFRRDRNTTGFSVNPIEQHRKFSLMKAARYLLMSIILIAAVYGVYQFVAGRKQVDSQVTIQGPKATLQINKDFSFPLKDSTGKVVNQFIYTIQTAELRDEIIVQGQKATAVAGRTFLILNLKIANQHNQNVSINTRDYVRLSVNGNENEWLAPDIHNDPVEVLAISTKYTRVGFAINSSDKSLVLQIGEINGDKQKIDLGGLLK